METVLVKAEEASLDRLLIGLGLFFAVLGSFFLMRSNYEGDLLEGVQPIGELTTGKSVNRRHARALAWGKIEKAGQLYPKDIVYTPPGISAEVVLNTHEKLFLAPDSMVEFDTLSKKGTQLVLLQGLAKIRDQSNQEKELKAVVEDIPLAPTVKPYQITPILLNTEAWKMTQADLLASVSAISRKLDFVPETAITVPNLNLNLLSDFVVQLFTAKMLSDSSQESPWYRLEWQSVPLSGVIYEVEISRAEDFNRLIKYETKNAFLEAQFVGTGKYFWRVTARNQREKSQSAIQSVMVGP